MRKTWLKIMLVTLSALALATPKLLADGAAQEPEPSVSVTPVGRYVDVDGDEDRFRQDWWMNNDLTGGLENASLERALQGDWKLSLSGRAIADEEDYLVRVDITNPKVGFIRAGYTEYRKYFDDSGGFFNFAAFPATSFALGQDLHMDLGDVYVELGLTLPNWPSIVLGYERKFKDGIKSMVEWGGVTGSGVTRNIFPAVKEIDDRVNIYKVDVNHEISNVQLGNLLRFERYKSAAVRLDETQVVLPNTVSGKTVTVHEGFKHDAFFNTFHMESQASEKVYWSAGYLFNSLSGEPSFAMDTVVDAGASGTTSGTDKFWAIRRASIDQDSHVLNVNAMYGPFRHLSIYGGIQAEKTQTDAISDVDLRERNFPTEQAVINTRNDKDWFQERIGVRCTRIPFTTLYAEAKWDQGSVALFEDEFITGVPPLVSEDVQRYTDTDITRQDYRVGISSSPVRRTNVSAYYRHNRRENEYNNVIDQILEDTGTSTDEIHQSGYSAFIDRQILTTNEIGVKLTLRAHSKCTVSFKYRMVATDIDTQFENTAANSRAGNYDANIYSVSVTCTPVNRLYATGMFSYLDTRTIGWDNGSALIVTYHGDALSILGALGYALDDKTDLRAEYSFSAANNFEDNSAAGLPYGADYQRHGVLLSLSRQLRENVVGRIGYGYYDLSEDNTGGINDYTAHLFSVACSVRF